MSYRGAGTVRGPLHFEGITNPGVSALGEGRIYFDTGTNTFQVSENNGAYVPLTNPSSAGGWTDDGTVVRLTTVTDGVGIGIATPAASSRLEVLGDGTRKNVLVTGGAPAGAAAGGSFAAVGGAGGATSGVGGAVSMTGGAGTAGNSAGGAASVVGGAGQGTAAGGALTFTGGAAGGSGGSVGGAVTITTGGGSATASGSGALQIKTGNSHGTIEIGRASCRERVS
jgi:hypothetical protein